MIRRFSLAIAILIAGAAFTHGLTALGSTISDTQPMLDAGVSAAAGSAFAPAVPDVSVESAGLVVKLWKNGALIPAMIVAAFLILTLASRYLTWLQTGKRAAYTAAALSALTTLACTAATGTTPNASMIVASLTAAVLLIMHPTQVQQPKPPGLGLVALFMATALVLSCGPKTVAALHQFASCAESAVAKDLVPTAQSILATGSPTWKQQLESLAGTFGSDVLDCAVNAAKSIFLQKFGGPVNTDAVQRADEWLQHGGA